MFINFRPNKDLWQVTSILSKKKSCQVLGVQLGISILTFHRPWCYPDSWFFRRGWGVNFKNSWEKKYFSQQKSCQSYVNDFQWSGCGGLPYRWREKHRAGPFWLFYQSPAPRWGSCWCRTHPDDSKCPNIKLLNLPSSWEIPQLLILLLRENVCALHKNETKLLNVLNIKKIDNILLKMAQCCGKLL